MKKILILNGSNTGTTMYFAEKIIEENTRKYNGEKPEIKILDLSVEFKGQLMSSETILSGSFYSDSDVYINMFLENDKIIAVSSMQNYALSDTIKAIINKIVVNGKTFGYNEYGPYALLEDKFREKEVVILFTSGSLKEYLPPAVQQIPQTLADTMKFIGFSKISIYWGDGTNMPDLVTKTLDQKYEAMREKVYFDL